MTGFAAPRVAGASSSITADRRVGLLIALGGSALVLITVPVAIERWGDAAGWWNVAAVVLAALILVLVALARTVPARALRAFWATIPALSLALALTWPLAETSGASSVPWVWELEPVAVSLLVLLVRWQWALVLSQAFALAVPVAIWAVQGSVPQDVVLQTPIHLGNMAFVAVFVALRRQLQQLARSERDAERREHGRLEAEAAAAEQQRFVSIVHDEILSTLVFAGRAAEGVGSTLVAPARRALGFLGAGGGDPVGQVDSIVTLVQARVAQVHPTARVTSRCEAVTVPPPVVDAVVSAMAEALRNSLIHARSGTQEQVSVHVTLVSDSSGLTVEVIDDGVGFDPHRAGTDSVGIRTSIVGRMTAVPGGDAVITSERGRGTCVTLSWNRHLSEALTPTGRADGGQALPDERGTGNLSTGRTPWPDLVPSGLGTRGARLALAYVWCTVAAHVLLGREDSPGPLALAVALLALFSSLLALTSHGPDHLSSRRAALALLAPLAAVIVLTLAADSSGVWTALVYLAGYQVGLAAVRGRVRGACGAGSALLLVLTAWAVGQRLDAPEVLELLLKPTAAIIVGTMWRRMLVGLVASVTAHRAAGARATSQANAMNAAVEAGRQRLEEVAEIVGPTLQVLARGRSLTDVQRADATLIEAGLRDRLRAPGLATADMVEACAQARSRGVDVRLLDDRGQPLVDPTTVAEAAGHVRGALAGQVTVRALPPGRGAELTVVLDDGRQVVRHELRGTRDHTTQTGAAEGRRHRRGR